MELDLQILELINKISSKQETIYNKAIRDGKYLARQMPVLGNVHPIKIDNFFVCVTSFLYSLKFLYD